MLWLLVVDKFLEFLNSHGFEVGMYQMTSYSYVLASMITIVSDRIDEGLNIRALLLKKRITSQSKKKTQTKLQ